MDIRFDGKVAVITGAGNGLGRCYALEFARRGAMVVVNDFGGSTSGEGQSTTPAQAVVDEITAWGGKAVANFGNVAEEESAVGIIETALKTFGTVDILVNNAGILRDRSFTKMTAADFDNVVKVHLYGSYYVSQAAFPVMRDKGYGRIVMTASAAGLYGNYGQTNYSSAKLGIIGLMNSLKEEGKKCDIMVNTVSPLAGSRLGANIFSPEIESILKQEYVAAAVLYLCSDQCQTTGRIISAGAGVYARNQILESRGVNFGQAGPVITPEIFASKYDEICDMKESRGFENGTEALAGWLKK
jgi:NAD(P)-dependent dehydrogenase (short-subunit alcohol dehydrogenase family)